MKKSSVFKKKIRMSKSEEAWERNFDKVQKRIERECERGR